ncbi:MAG: M23 family metallopeptidase [Spirochaetes bacterium]|nr:M23 family metallopeptidase [Spirochaetota bacterium]
MKKRILILSLLCFFSSLDSATLPVKRVKLTSTFGESRKDHFHNGMDFGGGVQSVHAIEDGKIIFFSDKDDFPFNNYFGSGNYVIVDHKKTRSYYMHLEDGSVNKTNISVKEDAILGKTSDTGHSYGIHLHFTLENKQPNQILNPLLFFKEAITDNVRPRIERFMVKVDDSDPVIISQSHQIPAGSEITLLINAYDTLQNNNNKMGVYKITCYLNNDKLTEYIFDRLNVKNNFYYLNPSYSFKDIYLDKYTYIIGKFPIKEKEYTIKVVVEDFAGNTAQTEKTLKITQ